MKFNIILAVLFTSVTAKNTCHPIDHAEKTISIEQGELIVDIQCFRDKTANVPFIGHFRTWCRLADTGCEEDLHDRESPIFNRHRLLTGADGTKSVRLVPDSLQVGHGMRCYLRSDRDDATGDTCFYVTAVR